MDNERNDLTQNQDWLDEVLETPAPQEELGPDEHAVASAGLIHPNDYELEQILAEHRREEAALRQAEAEAEAQDAEPEQIAFALPEEPAEEPAEEIAEEPAEETDLEATRFFAPQDAPSPAEAAAEVPQIAEHTEPAEEARPARKGRPKMKKGYGLLGIPHILATLIWLAIIVTVGISLGRTLWLCCADLMAFGKTPATAAITITNSDDIDSISAKLSDAGLIRYPGLFKTFAEITGKADNISTGTFHLDAKLDYNAMINGMTYYGSAREEVDVMFPEGYTCAQIFQLLEEKNVCTVKELEEYAANGELTEYWFLEGVERGDRYCLEGYLFPDTYTFYTNDDPGRVLEKFLAAFDDRFTDIMRERLEQIRVTYANMLSSEGYGQDYIDANPITIREVVIIASLIEKESSGADESYVISSVIYNRLSDSSQPPYLNIDAAVLYGLDGNIDPVTGESMALTESDLAIDTPYNTYLHTGLTPGPISNPGQESLNAALVPDDTNYLYYALNPETGKHEFFETYQGHLNFLASLED